MKYFFSIMLLALLSMNQLQAQNTVHIDEQTFKTKVFNYDNAKDWKQDWKYAGSEAAIIDFYATWCGPCKMVAPTLEELAKEYKGKLTIYKVDVDECPNVSNFFGITAIPTFLIIPKSGTPSFSRGYMDKAKFVKIIKNDLGIK